MQRFILLFRGSDVYQPEQSTEALGALTVKMIAWVGDLSREGKHVASERFQRIGKQVYDTTTTLDIPFSQGKEVIGGCTIVLAKDFNEALEIAKGCPILESNASIEVRPIQNV